MTLDETIYISDLYNIYGKLLTDKQSQILEKYIFDNLSLGEISEICSISPDYLSQVFKDEMGENLSTYITKRKKELNSLF